jgi:hypothetical protein
VGGAASSSGGGGGGYDAYAGGNYSGGGAAGDWYDKRGDKYSDTADGARLLATSALTETYKWVTGWPGQICACFGWLLATGVKVSAPDKAAASGTEGAGNGGALLQSGNTVGYQCVCACAVRHAHQSP